MYLKRFAVGLFGSTMLCTSGAAFAQPAQPAPAAPAAQPTADNGDVIIVTAQKRSENLQNVPISIQALGTQQLEDLNVTNFQDYTRLLPSISYQTFQPGTTNVYIRGVASGGDGNHSGSLPSVGVYLDEQPVTTIGGTLDVHIYDVARIEVLRGPQGTLYGASSEAGTIRIITNQPDPAHFSGAIDGEINSVAHGGIGGRLEGYRQRAAQRPGRAARGRLVPARCRLYRQYPRHPRLPARSRAGSSSTTTAWCKNNYNDVDVAGGRAALGIELAEHWTVTASLLGQDQRSHGSFGYDPSLGDLHVQHFYPEFDHDRFAQAALTIEGRIGNFDITYAGAYLDRKINTSNDYTDYAEAYDHLYPSRCGGIAGYFYFTDNAGNHDQPVAAHHRPRPFHQDEPRAPHRLAGDQSPCASSAGLFYQRQTHLIHQDYQVTGLADALSVNGFPGTLWLTQQNRVDRDYAAFGEASFDIVADLHPDRRPARLSLRQQPDRLLRLRPQSGGPAVQRRRQLAHRRRRLLHHHRAQTCATIRAAPCCRPRCRARPAPISPPSTTASSIPSRPAATASPTGSTRPGTSPRTICSTRPGRAASGPAASTAAARCAPYQKDTLTNYEIGFQTQLGPRLPAERRALLAGMAQVPILLPRREQLHRDPQRPRRADQGRRARAELAADPRLQPLGERRLHRRPDPAEPLPVRRSDLHLRGPPAIPTSSRRRRARGCR